MISSSWSFELRKIWSDLSRQQGTLSIKDQFYASLNYTPMIMLTINNLTFVYCATMRINTIIKSNKYCALLNDRLLPASSKAKKDWKSETRKGCIRKDRNYHVLYESRYYVNVVQYSLAICCSPINMYPSRELIYIDLKYNINSKLNSIKKKATMTQCLWLRALTITNMVRVVGEKISPSMFSSTVNWNQMLSTLEI